MKQVREWETTALPGHTVKVEHGLLLGAVHIYLDGQLIFHRKRKIFDTGLEHRFRIDDVPCIVRILPRVCDCTYELWVDGRLQ